VVKSGAKKFAFSSTIVIVNSSHLQNKYLLYLFTGLL